MTPSSDAVIGPLIHKLNRFSVLDDDDRQAIFDLPLRVTTVPAGSDLVREDQKIKECCLLSSGYAFRYKLAANGKRQIVSLHVAGDMLDLQHLLLTKADHSLQTLTEATLGWVPISSMMKLTKNRPRVGDAFWRDTLLDASVFREWILNVGRRDAKSRIAHLLCEFALRAQAAELGKPDRFELPLSQAHIADATGLTAVHVNRALKALADQGLIERNKREISITDWNRMRRVADFDEEYLHMVA